MFKIKELNITIFLSGIFFLMFVQVLNFDEEILVFFCLFTVFILLYVSFKDVLFNHFEQENKNIYDNLFWQLGEYQFKISSIVLALTQYVKILDFILKFYSLVKKLIIKNINKDYSSLKKIYIYIFNEYLARLLKEETSIWKLIYTHSIKKRMLYLRFFFKFKFLNYKFLKNIFSPNQKLSKNLFSYLYESIYLLSAKTQKLN